VVEVADTPLLTGGTTSCFRADDGSFAVEQPVGKGTLVALAGPDIWTNRLLADQDNGLLAADLLVASPGSKVAWLGVTRPDVARLGSGHATLWSLLGGRIRQMLVGLAVAMGVVAAWRARRLGRPVIEAQPVAIPGSALVAAKGRLLGGGHMTEHAAQILRADLARSLGETLHLPASSSAPTLAELASWRTGRQPEEILDLLSGPLPASDAELVELARQIDALEQEIDRHEVAHA